MPKLKHEYFHSLLESHHIYRKTTAVPDIAQIVLLVGDEKNLGKWTKGKVVHYIRGRDEVFWGLTLPLKGHIDRSLSPVCSLKLEVCLRMLKKQGHHQYLLTRRGLESGKGMLTPLKKEKILLQTKIETSYN